MNINYKFSKKWFALVIVIVLSLFGWAAGNSSSIYTCANPQNFNIAYSTNKPGDIKLIGNTNICKDKNNDGVCEDPGDTLNNDIDAHYKDGDTVAETLNSSSAKLVLPSGAKILWAGLYWQGYYGNTPNDTTKDASRSIKLGFSQDNVNKNIAYTTVVATDFNWVYFSEKRWYYQGFADVTDYVKSKGEGWFWGADINMELGKPKGGALGAWSIAIVYQDNNDTTKNLTVYKGYLSMAGNDDITNATNYANANGCDPSNTGVQSATDITLSGFKTPTSGTVESRLIFFAGEGDIRLSGDSMSVSNKTGTPISISDLANPSNNIANSSITDYGVHRGESLLYPRYGYNTIGIDIDTYDISSIIGNEQTSTNIHMTTSGDGYFPGGFGISTELYMPKLCYDYTATLNGEIMQMPEDRVFLPHRNKGDLAGKVFIRSLEGDFSYVKSTLKIGWSDITTPPSATPPLITFSKASVQNPHRYQYLEPEYTDATNGRYYIGIDKSKSGGYKGVIEPFESLYAISNFDTSNLYGSKIKLNVEVNASLAFDESDPNSLTTYTYSTSDGTLERCLGEITYNPKWYQFNIENAIANPGNYALNTQVTGTDYDLKVVSYEKDTDGNYVNPTNFTGGMEVEIFEIPAFQSLSSYKTDKDNFDRICEDSSNGKLWGDNKIHFINFNNTDTTPLRITKEDNKYAIRSTGVRLWVLMADYDGDGKLTDITANNKCTNTDASCFKNLWANDVYYKTQNTCDTACSGSDEECYECLKTYYSQPICSRDNFSIRPYGVQLEAKTKGNTIQRNDSIATQIVNLISGLTDDYTVIMTPKSANNQADPLGYYFARISTDARDIANNLFDTIKEFFGMKLDNTKVNRSVTSCADSNHKRFDLGTNNQWKLENDNVGNYDIELFDKDWTLVDQSRYKYKPKASRDRDDCKPNDTSTNVEGLQGCDVQSFEVNGDAAFNIIPVKFVPAKIDIQGVNYGSVHTDESTINPSLWAYMNNFKGILGDSDSISMAAIFQGNVVAQNAKGAAATNFTSGCFAQDVNISSEYSSKDLNDNGKVTSNASVGLQYAQNYNGIINSSGVVENPTITAADTQTNNLNDDKKVQMSISKDKFLDENEGVLLYDLRYAINKLYDVAISPIRVLFTKLKSQLLNDDGTPTVVWKEGYSPTTDPATLPADFTFEITDKKNIYTKNDSLDQTALNADIETNSFKFLYGRVYTDIEEKGESGKVVTDTNTTTNFDVLVYSATKPSGSLVYDDVAKTGILDTIAVDSAWYRVKAHSINENDGQIDNIAINSAEKGDPTITPQKDVKFDSNAANTTGRTGHVKFSYTKARPNKVVFRLIPSVWLKYNKNTSYNGEPEFVINFANFGYNWVGKGKTGNVVTQPATSSAKNRLNW